MRLINEDDVLEIIERVTNEAVEKKRPKYLIQPRIIAEIAGLPTVDAKPVKHGKWIEKKVCRMKWIPYADDDVNPDDVDIECMTEQKCSYCKRWTIKFTYHIELDYCPLCGARMDGDGE